MTISTDLIQKIKASKMQVQARQSMKENKIRINMHLNQIACYISHYIAFICDFVLYHRAIDADILYKIILSWKQIQIYYKILASAIHKRNAKICRQTSCGVGITCEKVNDFGIFIWLRIFLPFWSEIFLNELECFHFIFIDGDQISRRKNHFGYSRGKKKTRNQQCNFISV